MRGKTAGKKRKERREKILIWKRREGGRKEENKERKAMEHVIWRAQVKEKKKCKGDNEAREVYAGGYIIPASSSIHVPGPIL